MNSHPSTTDTENNQQQSKSDIVVSQTSVVSKGYITDDVPTISPPHKVNAEQDKSRTKANYLTRHLKQCAIVLQKSSSSDPIQQIHQVMAVQQSNFVTSKCWITQIVDFGSQHYQSDLMSFQLTNQGVTYQINGIKNSLRAFGNVTYQISKQHILNTTQITYKEKLNLQYRSGNTYSVSTTGQISVSHKHQITNIQSVIIVECPQTKLNGRLEMGLNLPINRRVEKLTMKKQQAKVLSQGLEFAICKIMQQDGQTLIIPLKNQEILQQEFEKILLRLQQSQVMELKPSSNRSKLNQRIKYILDISENDY